MNVTETALGDAQSGKDLYWGDMENRPGKVVMALYLTIVGSAATIGNTLVLLVILKNRDLYKNAHNVIMCNLALSDLGISIFGYPFSTASGYAGRWLGGQQTCQLFGFACTLLALSNINILVTLSIYRYISVCKPHLEHLIKKKSVLGGLLGAAWMYGLLWAVSAFWWTSYALEPSGISCSINWLGGSAGDISYCVLMILGVYVSHVCIMSFCYYNVNATTKAAMTKLRGRTVFKEDEARHQHKMAGESKVTKLSVAMVVVFFLIWSPYAWVIIWGIISPSTLPVWLTTWPTLFAKASCMMNPILYGLTNSAFRSKIKLLLCHSRLNRVDITRRQYREERQVYFVDRTKDGIFIGERPVEMTPVVRVF